MPNFNYIRGRNKEYRVLAEGRLQTKIAIRSAGSHSPIDCILIDINSNPKTIELIQCKPESLSENKRKKLEDMYAGLNDTFQVTFKVV